MQIIPVLDLLNGRIVRGIAGRREEYRPIQSKLTDSSEPLDVAHAIRSHFDLTHFYLADLDAIEGGEPSIELYGKLQAEGFQLWIDAGIRYADDAAPLIDAGVAGIIAGLETLAGPEELSALIDRCPNGQVIFSLDLKNGKPLTGSNVWNDCNPFPIAEQAFAAGVRRMIALDLAQVGRNEGTGTGPLCRKLIQAFPLVSVCAGGGIRSLDDLAGLHEIGVEHVLVASALHDGRLTRADIQAVCLS